MRNFASVLSLIAAVLGLVLGGGLLVVCLIAWPDTHVRDDRCFLVFLMVGGLSHAAFPWLGFYFARLRDKPLVVAYVIAALSLLLSLFLLLISGALLFGIAHP